MNSPSINIPRSSFPDQLRNDAQDKNWFGGSEHKVAFGDSDARFGPQNLDDVLTQDGLPGTKLVKAIRKIYSKRSSHFKSVTAGGRIDQVSVVGATKLLDAIRTRSDEGTRVYVPTWEYLSLSSEEVAIASRVFSITVQFEGPPLDETNAREILKKAELKLCKLENVCRLPSPTHLVISIDGILALWIATEPLPKEQWEPVNRKLHEIAIATEVISSDTQLPKIDASLVAPTTGKTKRPLNAHRLIKAGNPIPLAELVEAIEDRQAVLPFDRELAESGLKIDASAMLVEPEVPTA